jgi:isoamylase
MGHGGASEISRLLVSREVYLGKPFRGLPLNFVTAHDGFTMADLVSYKQKHNLANGNDNTDGDPNNHSRNHGVEGPTDDESIIDARYQDMRNLMLTLMVSGGVPMIRGGDELSATQGGNNNAYNQDNETTWINHDLTELRKRDFFEFVKKAIKFRSKRLLPLGINTKPNIQWLQGDDENFKDESWPHHRVVGMALTSFAIADAMGQEIEDDKVIFYTNGSRQDHIVRLPRGRFEVLFDTADGTANDEGKGKIVESGTFVIKALSSVVVGVRRLPEAMSNTAETIAVAT